MLCANSAAHQSPSDAGHNPTTSTGGFASVGDGTQAGWITGGYSGTISVNNAALILGTVPLFIASALVFGARNIAPRTELEAIGT